MRKVLVPLIVAVSLSFPVTAIATAQDEQVVPEARACDEIPSVHPEHTGFQVAPACATTEFGELNVAELNPSLLITDAPRKIKRGEGFQIEVSTRNLVRDQFPPAAQGGYYLETSQLNEDGLQRGHFHVACRYLPNDDEAPAPEDVPAFFKAVEDGGGGEAPDTVTVEVPGEKEDGSQTFPERGLVQCAAWAGDGSHRTPMMERANQTPAFDIVRLEVKGGDKDHDHDDDED